MLIAREKKKNNIAEYILYMWQLEDMLRALKLDMEHIKFVFDCLKENTTKIRNIKQYLLTTLYNAPTTIGNYYSALVQHDLHGSSRD